MVWTLFVYAFTCGLYSGLRQHHGLTIAVPLMVLGVALLGGCDATQRISDRDLVFVSVEEAQQVVQGQRRSVFAAPTPGAWVDARRIDEYRNSHIPGAVHLPLERARDGHERLYQFSVLIVYGSDFSGSRADAVSKILLELGHRDVRTLRGGMRAWQEAGLPVATLE
jgi:rhodanese-related sulfurtransferase